MLPLQIKWTNNVRKRLLEFNISENNIFEGVSHVFLSKSSKLDKNGQNILRLRIPPGYGYTYEHWQFELVNETNYVLAIGCSQWTTDRKQPWEKLIQCTVRAFYGKNIPGNILDQLDNKESYQETLKQKIERWEVYLNIEEKFVRSKQFLVRYDSRQIQPRNRPPKIIFDIETNGLTSISLQNIQQCRDGDELILTDYLFSHEDEKDESGLKLCFKKWDNNRIIATIREEDLKCFKEKKLKIPMRGEISNSIAASLITIERQKNAIQRLLNGDYSLPILPKLLFGDEDDLEFTPIAKVPPIPLDECLRQDRINERQRQAVAMALASPDCFFMQGPPGTGKTTFIAELCYQIVKNGKKILVSSQANLAVDNALSRLQNHPDLLAVRLGNPDRVSEEGQDFVGEKAIKRWLGSIRKVALNNLEQRQNLSKLIDLFVVHYSRIEKWSVEGKIWIIEKRRLEAEIEIKEKELSNKSTQIISLQEQIKIIEIACHYYTSLYSKFSGSNDLIYSYDSDIKIQIERLKVTEHWNLCHSSLRKLDQNISSNIREAIESLKLERNLLQRNSPLMQNLSRADLLIGELEKIDQEVQTFTQIYEALKQSSSECQQRIDHLSNEQEKFKPLFERGTSSLPDSTLIYSTSYRGTKERIQALRNVSSSRTGIKYNWKVILVNLFKICFRKSNIVSLIKTWKQLEINLSPNKKGKYIQIKEQLIFLKEMSVHLIFKWLFQSKYQNAKGETKSSCDKLEFIILHPKPSKDNRLSDKIYQELHEISSSIERKLELVKQENQRINQKLNLNLTKKNELLKKRSVLRREVVFFLENLNLNCKSKNSRELFYTLKEVYRQLVNRLNMINEKIRLLDHALSYIIKSLEADNTQKQNSLATLRQEVETVRGICIQKKQTIDERDIFFQESENIWKNLCDQKSVPPELDTDFPEYNKLKRSRYNWLNAIGGEECISRLEAEIHILTDWVSAMIAHDDVISPEFREVFNDCVNVIGATCSHTGKKSFYKDFKRFDVVIVDEVSKATPTELLMPCLLGEKIILVGDHKQLPPIFPNGESSFHEVAQELDLDVHRIIDQLTASLFKERYEYLDERQCNRTMMLYQQYRMHSQIMSAINQFYDNQLTIGYASQDNDRSHDITILEWLSPNQHLVWIDLPEDDNTWHHKQQKGSKQNPREADLAVLLLRQILSVFPSIQSQENLDIGVISVYKAQTLLLKSRINNEGLNKANVDMISVGTVDSFQGMEKDVIIVCLTFNHPSSKITDFLQTPERINVAMSRARKLLIIIGSSYSFTVNPSRAREMYSKILAIAQKNNSYFRANDILK